ncbi:endo-1,4-beta-xylanase [Luteolibacter pohnpeiensis]|uniref:Endo-1,4-beta-xylanase n=1 Tax=Luteolibacter pohnpeiensis TaxID=454153 RepID=A0A934VXL1_9BACT|nr:glycosyl hydrolase [Luteolibacter pohnpeiensis]MBK1884480.1 endo-1,4-beta-xylanase [Luteolibacter pohnpeiensis]
MKKSLLYLLLALPILVHAEPAKQWSPEKANEWYAKQPWPIGANYVPASAINQLEMWQAETYDPKRIDLELGWAESLGFNTMRVFLHDIPWKTDSDAYLKRIDGFLTICEKHKIRPMFVFFDSVWNPVVKAGKQPEPRPFVHNSGWVQSPGAEILKDPEHFDSLKPYVYGVIHHFRNDDRIFAWDLFNEPNNDNGGRFTETEAKDKFAKVLILLKKTFEWAREAEPSQPISSGVWNGDLKKMDEFDHFQLENSDIINFHIYSNLEKTKERVEILKRYHRPLICTEYMARPEGSTFEAILPYFAEQKIGAYNWGFVNGKSQTIFPWDSWTKEYKGEPELWFHDIFRHDGTPYKQDEVDLIRSLTKPN